MPDTAAALGVFVLAVLPGALYVWSFERVVGRWGIGLSDRVFRFVAASAFFQAAYFPILYHLRSQYLDRITSGDPLPSWLYAVPIGYLALPFAIGSIVGRSLGSDWRGARWLAHVIVGNDPAPRAWDYLFSSHPAGTVRLRLKSGAWIGGLFGSSSYAAGYPEAPQDIYLQESIAVNQHDGSFVLDDGRPKRLGASVLVRWDEIEFLDIVRIDEGAQ